MPAVLAIGGSEAPVAAVELRLGLASGPLLALQFQVGHGLSDEQRWALDGRAERGVLSWEQKELSFRYLSSRRLPDGRLELYGLVLSDELLGWFATPVTSEDARPLLVYQRQHTDTDGWAFVSRVLGLKFEKPTFATELDQWFAEGACVLRPSGWDNLSHVKRVVQLLGAAPGGSCSWSAFSADDRPLRLVATDVEALVLDEGWRLSPMADNYLPHDLVLHANAPNQIHRRLGPLQAADAATVLCELCCSGSRASINGAGEAGITSQLPHMPMPIVFRDSSLLCTAAVFRFSSPQTLSAEEQEASIVVELTLAPRPSRSMAPPLSWSALGLFNKWDEPSEKMRVRLKSTDQTWVLMGDGGSDDDGAETDPEAPAAGLALLCESVTPYAARDDFSGFYVQHQAKDQLVVELADFTVPRTQGGLQVFVEGFENAEVTLNSRTISMTGVANTADTNVTGMLLDGDSGTYEVFAEEEVRIKERISVVDGQSTFKHELEVAKDARLKGKLEVVKDTLLKAKLEVEGDAKIKGKLDVGG